METEKQQISDKKAGNLAKKEAGSNPLLRRFIKLPRSFFRAFSRRKAHSPLVTRPRPDGLNIREKEY
jgi:hypothetical protein